MALPPSHEKTALMAAVLAATAGGAVKLQDAGAIAAIIGTAIAVLLVVAGVWSRILQRNRRRAIAQFLNSGNELAVRLRALPNRNAFPPLKREIDAWYEGVEDYIRLNRPDLLPVLRSDADASVQGTPDEPTYFGIWLPQRLIQLEKVAGQI